MRAFLVIICKKAKIEVEDLDCINDIEKQFGLVKNIDAVRNLTADAITSYPFDIAVTNELQKFISYGTFRSLLASCSDHLHSLTSLISPSHLGINISLPMSRKCPQYYQRTLLPLVPPARFVACGKVCIAVQLHLFQSTATHMIVCPFLELGDHPRFASVVSAPCLPPIIDQLLPRGGIITSLIRTSHFVISISIPPLSRKCCNANNEHSTI